jgi:hypothetical protein
MVRAILNGQKTKTRRVVKPQPRLCDNVTRIEHHENQACDNWLAKVNEATLGIVNIKCQYGQVGDRLWVKETHCKSLLGNVVYRSTCAGIAKDNMRGGKWKPSIFMRRVDSRITLEIVSVRVERLQEITEEDAKREGVDGYFGTRDNSDPAYRCAYRILWEKINGAGSWAANPWVWVVEFKRVVL